MIYRSCFFYGHTYTKTHGNTFATTWLFFCLFLSSIPNILVLTYHIKSSFLIIYHLPYFHTIIHSFYTYFYIFPSTGLFIWVLYGYLVVFSCLRLPHAYTYTKILVILYVVFLRRPFIPFQGLYYKPYSYT